MGNLFSSKIVHPGTGQGAEEFLMISRRIIPVMFPACSPELNPVEECWNIGKEYLLGPTTPESFSKMKTGVSEY